MFEIEVPTSELKDFLIVFLIFRIKFFLKGVARVGTGVVAVEGERQTGTHHIFHCCAPYASLCSNLKLTQYSGRWKNISSRSDY